STASSTIGLSLQSDRGGRCPFPLPSLVPHPAPTEQRRPRRFPADTLSESVSIHPECADTRRSEPDCASWAVSQRAELTSRSNADVAKDAKKRQHPFAAFAAFAFHDAVS